MVQIIYILTLLALGYFVGTYLEKKHYKSIIKRERKLRRRHTTNLKNPIGPDPIAKAELVTGGVVISIDFFKKTLAGLKNLFGGNVSSYETLIDRARREAILRMKEACPNADQIIDVRIETSSISKGQKGNVGSVEVLAYGTAIEFVKAEIV